MKELFRVVVVLMLILSLTGAVSSAPGSRSITTLPMRFGAFNSNVGTISAIFIRWADAPPCFQGKTTFIWWESHDVSLDSIINGSQDDVIKSFGSKLCPDTIIAPFHEMNLSESPWSGVAPGNSAVKLVAAWKHIHNIIGSKAKYAWVVNNASIPDIEGNRPVDYWPGSDYVDIVGVDGFDWGGLSFCQSISPNFRTIKAYRKPVWVTSFGTANSPAQARWIADAVETAKAVGIQALIYFSYNDHIDFTLTTEGQVALR
ncbi:MAG: hypothetical protein R3D52_05750 [Xanthobacteraceae bacterium]